MKKLALLTLIILAISFSCKVKQKKFVTSNNALVLYDGVPFPSNQLNSINPKDIAEVTILKGASATALYGKKAENGVMLISSKKGEIKIYHKTLSSISQEYSKKILSLKNEDDILYVLNGSPLLKDYEPKLFKLNANQIKEVILKDSKTTKLEYGVDKKEGSVVITTK